MTFNQFSHAMGITHDRPNFHAWVVAHHGANADLPLETWRETWWEYAIPFDGSTPAEVRDEEPVSQYADSRDAAGM